MGELQRLGWGDVLVPAGLAVVGSAELAALQLPAWGAGVALELVSASLLVGRRLRPLLFATLAIVALLLMPWVGPALDEPAVPILFLAVAMYSLARWLPDHRGLIGVGVVLLMLLLDYVGADARTHDISDLLFVLALVVPPYVLGRVTRRLADHNALLVRNQELIRGAAIRDERDRIARELHDVIAHSVSAMVVQTAAAEDLVHTDPDRAVRVLADVTDTGRRALVETGRLLHVLRDESDEMGLAPAPGVDDLPALVDGFRESGLQVALQMTDTLPALSPGVDVSVYRIVQEALTNALKHGTGGTASIRVSARGGSLGIDASNPTDPEGAARVDGSGLGLVGMAERVALLGGRLSHGPDHGSFRVSVTVPLAAEGT